MNFLQPLVLLQPFTMALAGAPYQPRPSALRSRIDSRGSMVMIMVIVMIMVPERKPRRRGCDLEIRFHLDDGVGIPCRHCVINLQSVALHFRESLDHKGRVRVADGRSRIVLRLVANGGPTWPGIICVAGNRGGAGVVAWLLGIEIIENEFPEPPVSAGVEDELR